MRASLGGSYPPADLLDDGALEEIALAVGQSTGLQFPAEKRRDLRLRLTPLLMEAGPAEDLPRRVRTDPGFRQAVINRLTIGESYFFRNHPHFGALRRRIIPDLADRNRRRRRLSIWCAGCATGEEPYSIAMLLDEHFPELSGWDVAILATDINTEFLARAREGIYPPWSFRGVAKRVIERYFEPEGERNQRLCDGIRSRVSFERFNLGKCPFPETPDGSPFDILLCRNVLIYFSHELADAVVRQLAANVARHGYLMVGHAEAFPSLRELEAVYSDATYYYRNSSMRDRHSRVPAEGRTLSIPGLPVATITPADAAPVPVRRVADIRPLSAADGLPAPNRQTADASTPESLEAELIRIRELADSGEVRDAARLIGGLLKGPAQVDHRAHFLAALIADLDNRPADALTSLRQSLFLNKWFVIGHYYQGVICERDGDRRTAARCLRNVARLVAELPPGAAVEESGGITAGRLAEIVQERIKELEVDFGMKVEHGNNGRR